MLENTIENEFQTAQSEQFTTKRNTVPEIEALLYKPMKILDHGFIRVIDYMGDDSSVVQAARVSYGKGTKKTNQDRGLINYLMRHRHTTPFEMCELKLHIKLPIFVARQWIRHRMSSINEYSARYSILGKEFYMPNIENLAPQSQVNKQGRQDSTLPPEKANKVLDILQQDASTCYNHYIEMLNEDEKGNIIDPNDVGLTRELARMNLTLNYYTEWYWKIDLHNLLHFLALRADKHAQYEIRVYAEAILEVVKAWVPYCFEAFNEYKLNAYNFSYTALKVIKRKLAGEVVTLESSGLSKGEWQELNEVLK